MADEREMRETFGPKHVCMRLVAASGSPAERYVVEMRIRSLVGNPPERFGDAHRVDIELTNDYPRVAPRCRMLTPIFHPNIDASAICIGDHWTPGERLADLVHRIGEMLAFQAYNIRSPLNAEAAMWADLNAARLPTDARELRTR